MRDRWTELAALLRGLPYGKRMMNAIYVHRDTPALTEEPIRSVVDHACRAHGIADEFNVLKFRTDAARFSLLLYPDFYENPHPALAHSVAVDLESGTVYRTNYLHNPNPPILHRKELMISPKDRRRETFEALTAAEEAEGLYRNPVSIGFRSNWERLMSLAGLAHEGHTLRRVRAADPGFLHEHAPVHRHKTALTRYDLSKPVKSLLEYAQLRSGDSLFDYGCGLGSDVRALREMGFDAQGWDPVHAPEAELIEADVVNLGFVLNVIEDSQERSDTLRQAWHLARRLLVVSTLIANGNDTPAGASFQDGVLTTRKTFQKYFRQRELQEYIEDTLDTTALPVALGVFYVFRDQASKQLFLQSRTRRRVDLPELERHFKRPEERPRPAKPPRERRPSKAELYKDLLEEFWQNVVSLGREPEGAEFDRMTELLEAFGSARRALRILLDDQRREVLATAQESKRDDLLVYLASANLRTRLAQHHLPEHLRRDIKVFFGSYASGLALGLTLLRSAADPKTVTLACEEAEFGWQDTEALYIHSKLIERLPPVLRVYVACGELLFGSAQEADIVKIHKASGKITFLLYDKFDDLLLPRLLIRSKVNLRTGTLDAFDHSNDGQLLYFKERFIDPDNPQTDSLRVLGEKLRALGISEGAFLGPLSVQLFATAQAQNIDLKQSIGGYEIS